MCVMKCKFYLLEVILYSQTANPGDVLLTFVNQQNYFYQCRWCQCIQHDRHWLGNCFTLAHYGLETPFVKSCLLQETCHLYLFFFLF